MQLFQCGRARFHNKPVVAAINLSNEGSPMDVITTPETRSVTPTEVTAMTKLARTLPVQWKLETLQSDESGKVFAGLVAPRRDKLAFQVLLEGLEAGISATWWTGERIASGTPEEVFNAIREWLS
jgi:hypothetical protein